jgi:hypothetical protein
MTDQGTPDETLTAALIQISGHAERIAELNGRYQQLADGLNAVAMQVSAAAERGGGDSADQASVLASLDDLERQVNTLTTRLAAIAAGEDSQTHAGRYEPVPPPRWWKINGPDREASLARLRAWISQIYRPCYGRLAALLPPCWEDHPLCLNALDWLSELWSVLYLTANRSPEILAAQAEWQVRLLPAVADQMAAETDNCEHAAGAGSLSPQAWPGPGAAAR